MNMWTRLLGLVVWSAGCGVTVIPIDETDTEATGGSSSSSSSSTTSSTSTSTSTGTSSSSSEDSGSTESSSGSSSSEGDTSSSEGSSSSSSSSGDTSSSSGSGAECGPADECIIDDDCVLEGASCVACLCVGGMGCADWGEGVWADCLVEGVEACMGSDDAVCFQDAAVDPELGVCSEVCDDVCDCPEPPTGFEAQLTCEDLTGDGNHCFLMCDAGRACPDGWDCVLNTICMIGAPVVLDQYGDCHNLVGDCPDGAVGGPLCLDLADDGVNGEGSVCTIVGCSDADDCAVAPPTGTAVVACIDITGEAGGDCYLDCSGGEMCPDGMVCHADLGVCYFTPS